VISLAYVIVVARFGGTDNWRREKNTPNSFVVADVRADKKRLRLPRLCKAGTPTTRGKPVVQPVSRPNLVAGFCHSRGEGHVKDIFSITTLLSKLAELGDWRSELLYAVVAATDNTSYGV
jgi:hypothetical protein